MPWWISGNSTRCWAAREDYRALVEALHGRGLGQILDVCPNHMSATPVENPWWNNVLENGPGSPYAAYFDVDWRPSRRNCKTRSCCRMLGEQYGQVLEAGELQLEFRDGAFFIRYFLTLLPLEPRTYPDRLGPSAGRTEGDAAGRVGGRCGNWRASSRPWTTCPTTRTPTPAASPSGSGRRRSSRTGSAGWPTARPPSPNSSPATCRSSTARRDDPHSYDRLDKLLDAQVYRLAHWKAAGDEINYRRFFDVNDLAAVCMEDPQVFEESHRLVFDLLVRGDADALRIDHIDGLYDPMEYLRRLQWGYVRALGADALASEHQGLASLPPAGACPWRPARKSPGLPLGTMRREGEDGRETSGTRPPEWSQVGAGLPAGGRRAGRRFLAVALCCGRDGSRPGRRASRPAGGSPGGGLAGPSALRGRGKDPRPRGTPARALARGRHHRLRLPQSRQRAVRRRGRIERVGQGLQPLHRPAARLPRSRLRIQAADLAGDDGQRGATCWPTGSIAFRGGTGGRATSRSTPCAGAARDPRLLSRLSHLYPRGPRLRARPAVRRPGRGPGQAPQPDRGRRRVRLHPRRAAAASFRRRWTRPTGRSGNCSWAASSRPPAR